LPDRGDHRNSDLGKDIDRRAQYRERTDQHEQQRKNDERIWAPQGYAD
jgi:hypothetical protein